MEVKKTDFRLIKDGEAAGLMVSMTNILEPIRTEKNNTLHRYFCDKLPNFQSILDDEDACESFLSELNDWIKQNNILKRAIDFPVTGGSDIYLFPITKNLSLKILISDEYFGSGDFEKYIEIGGFIINDETTEKDVDDLIDWLNIHLI